MQEATQAGPKLAPWPVLGHGDDRHRDQPANEARQGSFPYRYADDDGVLGNITC